MNVDIGSNQLSEVRTILRKIVPDATVWVFGSRITGKAKRFSDLDLALISDKPIASETIWDLRESFSDSDLPFRVDVIDLASVSADFKLIVEKAHTVLLP